MIGRKFCIILIVLFSAFSHADSVLSWKAASIEVKGCVLRASLSGKDYTEFVIEAFDRRFAVSSEDLKKLSSYPLSSVLIVQNDFKSSVGAYTILMKKKFQSKGDVHDAQLTVTCTASGELLINEQVFRHRRAP